MSKIGKIPITVNNDIKVTMEGSAFKVNGPKGEASYEIPSGISVKLEDGQLKLNIVNENDKTISAIYGLTRANLANIIKGVESGFEKKLELQGVGYRAQLQGNELVLSLGFSHPVKFKIPQNIKIVVAENIITISGIDKILVGETAAKIRGIKPPEPYKGKGIRYKGEVVRRKVGKAAKAVGTK